MSSIAAWHKRQKANALSRGLKAMPRPRRLQTSFESPLRIPDRSLAPQESLPVVTIRSAGAHQFVYRKMVERPVGAAPNDGDLVRVVERDGQHLGFGLWNGRSQISLRFLSRREEQPGLDFWSRRIDQAVALRTTVLGLESQTNAYRVIHAEGDSLSGLVVDRFDDVLSAEVFSLGMYQRIGPILDLCAQRLGTAHFRVGVDERVALQEDFPGRPLASSDVPPRVTIQEHGIRYRIHFEHGHKTGFFCDQRDNRRELARFCGDRTVLDLCCYSGGFALNALIRGQAREVTCVDLDENAVALARENGNANNVRLNVVHADAFGYMRQMALNQRCYQLVVLDPPKLILDRNEVAGGKRKYFDLNVMAMKLVERGGLLVTCSCSGLMDATEFVVLLRAAARKAEREAQLLAFTGAAADHPVALDALEGAYLKVAWLRIDERS
jgi:23S rRNA (cytosine1962-C5)-methyltransferase